MAKRALPVNRGDRSGFTLIELSIVLVIVGLIVGGVLVGQDLIRAAEIRATITQIEKFNTAKNTFLGKYGALPGDMTNGVALTYGFASRPGLTGEGDGDGLLDAPINKLSQCGGEVGMFWSDMTYANGMNLGLVEGSFGAGASPLITPTSVPTITGTQLNQCFPSAKLGKGNFFYVYETFGQNYFGLSALQDSGLFSGSFLGTPALSVLQAYTIDTKVDDGLPMTGNTEINYINSNALFQSNPGGGASRYTAATYYNSATNVYATDSTINGNGTAGLCALSFRFQ